MNKDVQQRTEQVRDTVRRSDVQVERLPGKETVESSGKTADTTTPGAAAWSKTSQP